MNTQDIVQRSAARLVRLVTTGLIVAALSVGVGLVRGSAAVTSVPSRSVFVQDHAATQHHNGSAHHGRTEHRGGGHHRHDHDNRDCWWDDWSWDGWWDHDRGCCDEHGEDHWC